MERYNFIVGFKELYKWVCVCVWLLLLCMQLTSYNKVSPRTLCLKYLLLDQVKLGYAYKYIILFDIFLRDAIFVQSSRLRCFFRFKQMPKEKVAIAMPGPCLSICCMLLLIDVPYNFSEWFFLQIS